MDAIFNYIMCICACLYICTSVHMWVPMQLHVGMYACVYRQPKLTPCVFFGESPIVFIELECAFEPEIHQLHLV